jgi:ribose 5-phosphate isomerase A
MHRMTQDELKAAVGQAALAYVVPDTVVGVGTGSTVNCFIDALASMRDRIKGAVSSSEQSSERLRARGIAVLDGNALQDIPIYIDGADEIDHGGFMIKGGGAALTREKIVADMAQRFICIADASKLVQTLGAYPLPIEVIPMAAAQIERKLRELGGHPSVRAGVLTDNACRIIDVRGLTITDPAALEREMNQWPGVVSVGIFARNKASVCLLGTQQGVKTLTF